MHTEEDGLEISSRLVATLALRLHMDFHVDVLVEKPKAHKSLFGGDLEAVKDLGVLIQRYLN